MYIDALSFLEEYFIKGKIGKLKVYNFQNIDVPIFLERAKKKRDSYKMKQQE